MHVILSLSWGIARVLQNHRKAGVGRERCGPCSSAPLPKQGHLEQAAQDLIQAGLQYHHFVYFALFLLLLIVLLV